MLTKVFPLVHPYETGFKFILYLCRPKHSMLCVLLTICIIAGNYFNLSIIIDACTMLNRKPIYFHHYLPKKMNLMKLRHLVCVGGR